MGCTLAGLLTLSLAHQFPVVLLAAALLSWINCVIIASASAN